MMIPLPTPILLLLLTIIGVLGFTMVSRVIERQLWMHIGKKEKGEWRMANLLILSCSAYQIAAMWL